MAGRGAGGGAQRGQERGGRHEPAAGAGASTDPDRCAPPPCGGPSGCAVPLAGSKERARACHVIHLRTLFVRQTSHLYLKISARKNRTWKMYRCAQHVVKIIIVVVSAVRDGYLSKVHMPARSAPRLRRNPPPAALTAGKTHRYLNDGRVP